MILTPLTPSSIFSGTPSDTVEIKYPFYLDEFFQNVLITLHAFDRLGGRLHYGTALIACGLIAGKCLEWLLYGGPSRSTDNIKRR